MNNSTNDMRTQAAAQRFAENLAKYPIEEQIAVGAISKNVLNGCSWEFVRKSRDFMENMDAFKASRNVNLQEVVYDHGRGVSGFLVVMNMNYLCNLLAREAPGLIRQEDLKRATEHRQQAIQSLYNRMKSGYKGRIGVYCTNDSQSITIQGKTFPAYAVTLREMLQVADRAGYGVFVNGSVRSPKDVARHEEAVLKALEVAPSGNALFINIAPM